MSTTEQDLPSPVLEYLSAQNTLTLATASPAGTPHAATFLYVNEGPSLYFWSKTSAESARHIEQNPQVAFTIDEYTSDLTQTRGNYVVSWGNTQWAQQDQITGTPTVNLPVRFLRSAFGHYSINLASIADGTSSTVFMAEVLQGRDGDSRGLIWGPTANFMSRFTPNGTTDYYGVAVPSGSQGDQIGTGCVSEPSLGLPCGSVPFPWLDAFQGARSRHPGGVNVLFGDGSVRFLKNSINPQVWVGLNSIAGSEVIGQDSY